MRFNKILTYLFFSLLIIVNQSFQCEDRFPEPGVVQLNVSVVDENNESVPYALMGLFNDVGCLIDTFYSDSDGKRFYSFLNEKNYYYSLNVLPDLVSSAVNFQANGVYDFNFIVEQPAPLIFVHLNSDLYDKREVINYNLFDQSLNFYNGNCHNSLDSVKTYLDKRTVLNPLDTPILNTPIVILSAMNMYNTIVINNIKNDSIVSDTIISVFVGTEKLDVEVD